ncbi:hypothetical protein THAOC_07842, partial [Thalassiosira oceanica]
DASEWFAVTTARVTLDVAREEGTTTEGVGPRPEDPPAVNFAFAWCPVEIYFPGEESPGGRRARRLGAQSRRGSIGLVRVEVGVRAWAALPIAEPGADASGGCSGCAEEPRHPGAGQGVLQRGGIHGRHRRYNNDEDEATRKPTNLAYLFHTHTLNDLALGGYWQRADRAGVPLLPLRSFKRVWERRSGAFPSSGARQVTSVQGITGTSGPSPRHALLRDKGEAILRQTGGAGFGGCHPSEQEYEESSSAAASSVAERREGSLIATSLGGNPLGLPLLRRHALLRGQGACPWSIGPPSERHEGLVIRF